MDWRDQNNWGCNDERNPYGAHYLDGGSLETMEVMFVKVKQRLIDLDWSYPYAATQYDKWYLALDEVCPAVLLHIGSTSQRTVAVKVHPELRVVCDSSVAACCQRACTTPSHPLQHAWLVLLSLSRMHRSCSRS